MFYTGIISLSHDEYYLLPRKKKQKCFISWATLCSEITMRYLKRKISFFRKILLIPCTVMSISDDPNKILWPFFCKLMCVGSSAWGESGKVPGKGGHLLLPPHPPTALPRQCYEQTLVCKKKVTRFCLAHHLWTSLCVVYFTLSELNLSARWSVVISHYVSPQDVTQSSHSFGLNILNWFWDLLSKCAFVQPSRRLSKDL